MNLHDHTHCPESIRQNVLPLFTKCDGTMKSSMDWLDEHVYDQYSGMIFGVHMVHNWPTISSWLKWFVRARKRRCFFSLLACSLHIFSFHCSIWDIYDGKWQYDKNRVYHQGTRQIAGTIKLITVQIALESKLFFIFVGPREKLHWRSQKLLSSLSQRAYDAHNEPTISAEVCDCDASNVRTTMH